MSGVSAGSSSATAAAGEPPAGSLRNSLTRALLVLTFTTGIVGAVSYRGLLLLAALLAAIVTVRAGAFSGDAVIAFLALGMGVRNAKVRTFAVPDLTTTVLTMTITGLAAGLPQFGGSTAGTVRRSAAVLAMGVGALAGALLLKTDLVLPLVVAAALASLAWMVYVAAARRAR